MMILLAQNMTNQIQHFFNWWFYELGLLIPQWLRQILSPTKPQLFIRLHNYQVFCSYFEQGVEKNLLSFYLHKEGIQQLTDFLKTQIVWQQASKILLLSPKQLLKTRLDLPLAAQENITQVIGYELDRYTPFTPEQCYFATHSLGKNLTGNRLILELLFISKPKLHHYHSLLNDLGLAPDIIGHTSDGERFRTLYSLPYNLLPPAFQKQQQQTLYNLKRVLIVGLCILTSIALGLPFWIQQNTLANLQQQVAVAKKQAIEVEGIKTETNALLQAEQKITGLKQGAPVILNTIEQLSTLLPKDTWLKSFEYKDNKITLQGLSASSSALIGLLEGSPHFRQATLVSPVTRDNQEALDKFELEATLEVAHDR